MLTPTHADLRSFSYPIGNTPASNLLRDLRPGKEPVEILALGCGDVRNILFTIWSQKNIRCKLNFTACDSDPAVLARNVFLLTAIPHDPSSEEIHRLWRTYYHFYVTSADLLFVQQHCQKLLTASESLSTWNGSPFGSSLKFSTEASLSEVRRMWLLYSQDRSKQEDVEARRAIKFMYGHSLTSDGKPIFVRHSVRAAGAHCVEASAALNEAFHDFWQTGVIAGNDQDMATLNRDDGGRANPLMVVCSLGSFNVHHDLDPFISFHLAEGFDLSQTTKATTNCLVRLAKSQFSGWCREFVARVASESVRIMHHCGDAVNFSHALQAIQGSATMLPFTYFYTKPWSPIPLDLPADMVTSYDVIDTSNVMDHVGLLNLLSAITPLLSGRRDSALYTESLLQGAEKSERLLKTLLHMDVTMASLLLSIAPVGYLLGTMTDSTHAERLLDLHILSANGTQLQYRMRIPWKRAAQGDSLMPSIQGAPYRLDMDPHELASFFMQIYLAMFREEEDVSIIMRVHERKLTRLLVGDLGFYSRLSLVTLLASAKRSISTDWSVCVDALVKMITNDKVLMVSPHSLQELYMHLHLLGLWQAPRLEGNPRQHRSYYGGPRPAGEPGFLGQQSLPSTVHVALVVPRSKLAVFKDHQNRQAGPVGVHLSMRTLEIDNWFHALDIFFGQFELDDIDTADVVEDTSGWLGTSDMIVTCKVPTWGFLVGRRENFRIELCVNASHVGQRYIPALGFHLTVFGAGLDSKNVRILTHAPCTKPRPVSRPEHAKVSEPTGPATATVSLNRDGTVQSIGVTKNFAPSSEADTALKSGDAVEIEQTSACVLAVPIGERENMSNFAFPYPINGAACKVKIARKSSWIEIKAPASNALQPGGFNLDPFPVISQDLRPLAWGMSRIDPDLQPLVRISAPDPTYVDVLGCMMLSRADLAQVRANLGPGSVAPMVQLKQILAQIFSRCAELHRDGTSEQVRTWIIKYDEGYKFHIIANGLRHDRDTGSVFLDGFFIPGSADFDEHMATNRPREKCAVTTASREDMKLWLHFIPAVIERCRSWEHASECTSKAGSIQFAFCGCGVGKDSERMPIGYEDIAGFATRFALPLISAVPYAESVDDDEMISRMSAHLAELNLDQMEEASGSDVCDNCGNSKPDLKACTRCEKVKYCNHACQKAAWREHKKVCKR